MRMLSKGRTKVAVLTVQPADPANPTVAELDGGIPNAADYIPSSMWTFGAGDPTTVDDTPLSSQATANVPDEATYDLGFGVYRMFAADGTFDPVEDALFEATKVMGTTLWVYARKTGKLSTEAWADGDEFYLGGEVQTSSPKNVDEGNIKYEVPLFAQRMYEFGTVGAATAPTVTGVAAPGGTLPTAGGENFTISGNGFTPDVTGVTVGGVAATGVTYINGHTIVATAPAHAAGEVDVIVTTPAGSSATSALSKVTYV